MRLRQRPAARRDIARFYRQSVIQFGALQADRYFVGFETFVRRLLEFPESAPVRGELRGGIRLARYESHHIFYRIEGDDLVLVRVLHGHQDIARHLRP